MPSNRIVVPVLALVLAAALWAPTLRATSSRSFVSAPTIATLDTLSLLEELLQTPEYAEMREEMGAEFQGRLEAESNTIMGMNNELQTLQPGDPRGNELYAQIQSRRQNLTQMQQSMMAEFESISAGHAAEVYTRIHAAASTVADQNGYSHVISKRSGNAIEESASLTQVTQEILARPAMISPDGDDITARVRALLGLPEPGADDTTDNDTGENAGDADAQP